MNPGFRARYGEVDNSHGLLWQADTSVVLPGVLANLTDRPGGYEQPGEQWWPALGCGPVGDWWALWWTTPDGNAVRKGMVRSEVALWPLLEIGAVDDLAPIIGALAGSPLSTPPVVWVETLAEAFLDAAGKPPVVVGLEYWPGLIATLWRRLWPEARRSFSGRVALAPPQGGESVAPPLVYAIPGGRVLQWPERKHIAVGQLAASPGRGARWLAGATDARLEELVAQCDGRPAELSHVGRLARATEGLERLRQEPDCDTALRLLRTLISLAPGQGMAALKQEALSAIKDGLERAGLTTVLSLANIPAADVPPDGTPKEALVRWVHAHTLMLPLLDAIQLLTKAGTEGPEPWWRDGVRVALKTGFDRGQMAWAAAAVQWLGFTQAKTVLNTILPATGPVESRLLEATVGLCLLAEQLPPFQAQCAQRKWSRLHAWCVMGVLPARDAIAAQLAFGGDPKGLAYLVERLPGPELVKQAISSSGAPLIPLTAHRTAREPGLLRGLDASQAGWRTLWAAHVEAGGLHWPDTESRERLGGDLLDALLAGDAPTGLVDALAPDLAALALDHHQRERLWSRFSAPAASSLLKHTAVALIQRCATGEDVTTPESVLAEEVIRQARAGKPAARVITSLVSWEVALDEGEVARWIAGSRDLDWAPVANELGRGVARRGWGRVASEMYSQCRLVIPELRSGVQLCVNLLSRWEQFVFLALYAPSVIGQIDQETLARRLAELGAALAPEQAADYLERAGGKSKDFSKVGTHDTHWREAANRARNGSVPGGLKALLNELQHDFPHNEALRELGQLLK